MRHRLAVAALLACLAVAGCGGASHTAVAKVGHCQATIIGVNVNSAGPPTEATLEMLLGRKLKPCAPFNVNLPPGASPHAEYEAGEILVATSGCLACHKIGEKGNVGPGQNLSRVGSERSRAEIERALIDPREPMPSFRNLPAGHLKAIVTFLTMLRVTSQPSGRRKVNVAELNAEISGIRANLGERGIPVSEAGAAAVARYELLQKHLKAAYSGYILPAK
jgi:mono/diheme cytochrome c family protein